MPLNFYKFFNKPVLFFTVLIFLFLNVNLFAQTGSIKGLVTDSDTDEALTGANVIIQGTTLGAATDFDGAYLIRNIPVGTHTLVVSYIGYQKKSIEINIIENRTLEQNVTLKLNAIEGQEVTITAQAQGQLEAINQQLTSDNIANIVSESRIQKLADFNAAAALSRLPGVSTTQSSGEANKVVIRGLSPKFNSIEIEGVRLSATGSSSIGLTSDIYVTTNGVQNDRSVDLSMVSPYMLRTIAVYKSLTPDMNANSIGGTVNMELREAPAGLNYDLLWQQGYTAKSGSYGNYRAVASASDRFFDNALGVYALINLESYDRDADNLGAGYDIAAEEVDKDKITGYRPVKVRDVTFTRHYETRDRYGANLILDYILPGGSVKFVNMFARLNSDYQDNRQSINYNDGRLGWRLQLGDNTIDQRMHSLKFDLDFGFITTDLSASYTSSRNTLENSHVMNFNQVAGVLIQDRDNLVPEDLSYLVNYAGDSSVVLRSGNLFSNYYKEDKYTFKADFEIPFNLGNAASGFIKFGGQYGTQSNSTDQEAPYLGFNGSATGEGDDIQSKLMRGIKDKFGINVNSAGDLIGTSFLSTEDGVFDPFLDNTYGEIYYAADPTLLQDIIDYIISNPEFDASNTAYSSGREGGWYDGPYQQLTNDYTYDEDNYAIYAMAKINFLDFVVIGGARYENVKSDYFAYNARDIRNAQLQKMYDTTSVNKNDFLLPMAQIKYSPFDWMDVRYAYTQTLSRPDYQQLSPKFTITQNNDIYAGNPELEPAKAFNHDLSFTFHTNEIGLFTIGGFYKTIENFVYSAEYRLDAAQNAGVDSLRRYQVWRDGVAVVNPVSEKGNIHRPLNNPFDATVKGIELDFQHNFWYLPEPFNNLVFGINYTRIQSESRYPFYTVESIPGSRPPKFSLIDSSATGRLIDQPNHIVNVYVGYDYEGFSSRLSILYQDNSARYNGGAYPENDSYTKEYFKVDFHASQKLPWYNIELFLDLINLNNEKTRWVQKSTGGYQGIQNYGLTANLGLRIRY